jgi:ACS family hexuronate transporter-like MFS transporter
MVDDRLITVGSVISYLTRSTLAIAAPTVLKDRHITTRQYSWIVGGLGATVGYMSFFICLGVLDLYGAAALWSLVLERN